MLYVVLVFVGGFGRWRSLVRVWFVRALLRRVGASVHDTVLKSKETLWKGHGLMLIGDFYFSRKEYVKAKDFYTQILTVKNLQPELYEQAKMKLINIAND